jgi:hypothetical protein
MTKSTRYHGTLKKVKEDGSSGFIDRRSVRNEDGTPARLGTRKDIYLGKSSSRDALVVDHEYTFMVERDRVRENALRAVHARDAALLPYKDGVCLTFTSRLIDHPVVELEWCLKPDVREYMRANSDKLWALIIIAKPKAVVTDDDVYYPQNKTAVQTINGAEKIALGHGYLEFRGPGEYDLVGYLVCSTGTPSQFWGRLKDLREENQERVRLTTHDGDLVVTAEDLHDLRSDADEVVAYNRQEVELPREIFAKPLSGATKSYLTYFLWWRRGKLKDECNMRSRLLLALLLLPIYLVCELLKRALFFLGGFVHFLVGGNPFRVWRHTFSGRVSATWPRGEFGSHEYRPIIKYHGWTNVFRPWIVLSTTAVVSIFAIWPKLLVTALILIVMVVVLLGIVVGLYALGKYLMKLYEASAPKRIAEALARIEVYAACGVTSPAKPGSIKLYWTGIKRKVCRPFG